jgi:type I restriction enzyme S subunit
MSDWSEVRVSELATIDIGGTPSRAIPAFWAEKPNGYPWISIADLKGKYVSETKEHITALGVRSSNVKLIPERTTVMSFKLTVGRTAITAKEMYCNEAIAILQPKDGRLDPSWLYHALPRAASSVVTDTAVKGATLNKAKMAEMSLRLPPSSEQAIIAKVLDTLDTAIHETEAIIAKLEAVKQGLLHDLLTRGIDANGELRPPQAEAPQLYKQSPLGWIPKEWDITTLEAVSSTVTSGSRDWARFYADSGALFVRIGNLTREHINLRFDSTMYVRPPRNADGQRTRLEPGDILISITADLGIVGVVPDGIGEAYINQHIALVRPSHGVVNPRFVGHYLASPVAQTYICKMNDAGAKAGLNLPTVRGLLTVRPDRMEQNLISERLDEIVNRIQNSTTESAKLRELKSGLMDDLLTGRVRVTPLLATEQEGSA